MGKRRDKPPDGPSGPTAPFWMVTYSDMVTLLLTFFVLLMSMANFEEVGRVEAVLDSIRLALGADGYNTSALGATPEPQNQPAEIQPMDNLQPVLSQLRDALSAKVSDDMVKMTRTQTEIRVSLSDRVLFAPGSTELHPAAYSLLSELGAALAGQPVNVRVEGHTDATGDAQRNWELSALRAVSVTVALQSSGGIEGRNLEAVGYGAFRPASPEGNVDGRWDRRVELVIQAKTALAHDAVYKVQEITGGSDGG